MQPLKGKKVHDMDRITVFRYRKPTNEHTAGLAPNMVFDHSNQMPIWPDQNPRALIESKSASHGGTMRTMNRSGHPFALGVDVGASPDTHGSILTSREKRAKFTR